MPAKFSAELKARMVAKLLAPGGPTARALADETGIGQTTLSAWVRQARAAQHASDDPPQAKRPQDWPAEERLRLVLEASGLEELELGVFLRGQGVPLVTYRQWRQMALDGVGASLPSRRSSPERRRIQDLERELQRKEKALAEAAALLILKKKAQQIWGDEDGSTL
jgi:transposase-like protein